MPTGIDTSPVEPEPAVNKGYGNSLTLPFDVTDILHARLALLGLSETLGARMRKRPGQGSGVYALRKNLGFSLLFPSEEIF